MVVPKKKIGVGVVPDRASPVDGVERRPLSEGPNEADLERVLPFRRNFGAAVAFFCDEGREGARFFRRGEQKVLHFEAA